MQLTNLLDFQTNYEVKNGQIADSVVLNKAVDLVKQEFNFLWEFISMGSSVIDDGDSFIDDNIGTISNNRVRSIQGLHNEIFNGGTWS